MILFHYIVDMYQIQPGDHQGQNRVLYLPESNELCTGMHPSYDCLRNQDIVINGIGSWSVTESPCSLMFASVCEDYGMDK